MGNLRGRLENLKSGLEIAALFFTAIATGLELAVAHTAQTTEAAETVTKNAYVAAGMAGLAMGAIMVGLATGVAAKQVAGATNRDARRSFLNGTTIGTEPRDDIEASAEGTLTLAPGSNA